MSITYCIEISNNNIFITNESLVYYENDEMKIQNVIIHGECVSRIYIELNNTFILNILLGT